MFKRSLISALDQAVISGLNFGIGLVLIATVSKPEYGLYVQLFATGVLLNALTDALVGNAITNRLAREGSDKLSTLLQEGRTVVSRIAVFLTLVATLLGWWLAKDEGDLFHAFTIAGAFALYAGSLVIRDFLRTQYHLREQPQHVLFLDVSYAICVLLFGVVVYFLFELSVPVILFSMAAANLISKINSYRINHFPLNGESISIQWKVLLKQYWQYTSWAVIGVLIGWTANNLFIFASAEILGLQATAELNAARLLLMPLTLMGVAWGQSSRANIANLVQKQLLNELIQLLRKSIFFLFIICILYGSCLIFVFPYISHIQAFQKYKNLDHLIIWWLPYMLLFVAKFIGTITLTVMEVYRPMVFMTFASLCLQIGLLILVPHDIHGAKSVIWCLMGAELFELSVMWLYLMPSTLKARGLVRHAS